MNRSKVTIFQLTHLRKRFLSQNSDSSRIFIKNTLSDIQSHFDGADVCAIDRNSVVNQNEQIDQGLDILSLQAPPHRKYRDNDSALSGRTQSKCSTQKNRDWGAVERPQAGTVDPHRGNVEGPLGKLSRRSALRLNLQGITSLEEIAALTETDIQLLPGLGSHSLQEIRALLEENGLAFAPPRETTPAKAIPLPKDPAERDEMIYQCYLAQKIGDVPDKLISHRLGIPLDKLTSALQQHRHRMERRAELSHTDLDGLSDKIKITLAAENISSFSQLAQMTEKALKGVPNLGAKTIAEIKKSLGERGLSLKQPQPDPLAPLSRRLIETLNAHNIKSAEDLQKISRNELQTRYWLGTRAVDEIASFMEEQGLNFAQDPFNPETDSIGRFLKAILDPNFCWPEPQKKPHGCLRTTAEERQALIAIYRNGGDFPQRRKKATILLASAAGYPNLQIAKEIPVLNNFVAKVRRRFMVNGLGSLQS